MNKHTVGLVPGIAAGVIVLALCGAAAIERESPSVGLSTLPCIVDLSFDDNTLPSSHGLTYAGSTTEQSAFSASDGLLHLDTTALGPWVTAGYRLDAVYDATLDFVMEFRMRVFPGTYPFGVDFEVSDTMLDFEFGFTTTGLFLPPVSHVRRFLPFDPADGFHTYRVESPGGQPTYRLFIDGTLHAAGMVDHSGDPGDRFLFGDLTTGSTGRADIESVRFCQSRAVPIDIKPGSYPNSINLGSRGLVPLAILSTAEVDATTVDATTVTLAGAPVSLGPTGIARASIEDVNGDVLPDLLLHFETRMLRLTLWSTEAVLEGRTLAGVPVRGVDSVRVVR